MWIPWYAPWYLQKLVITKPTKISDKSTTQKDVIYINLLQKVLKSGICLAGITDH